MNVEILGCGASSGVPVLLCACETCQSKKEKNNRHRCSVWLNVEGKDILIDTSADFRFQALRANILKIDAVLYTHPHADHVNGIDDIKIYNFTQKKSIPCFGHDWTRLELTQRFPYIFPDMKMPVSNLPRLSFHLVEPFQETLLVEGLSFTPIAVQHGKNVCLGYRHRAFAYVTDCNFISDRSLERLENLDVLILDCLQFKPHHTHFTLDQALEVVRKVQPKTTILTHMSHDIDYYKHKEYLPKSVFFGFDTLKI